jgi:predicted nucleic acid-binding Zn ribbon protein
MKVKPEKTCPKCTKQTAERCITGGLGVVFRGSGFYCTDYKKGKKPDA